MRISILSRSALASLALAACTLVACSNNDANGFGDAGDGDASFDATVDVFSLPLPTGEDAGEDTNAPTGDDDSGNNSGDDDTTGDDDSGNAGDDDGGSISDAGHDSGVDGGGPVDCGAAVNFHPDDGSAGPYCPFSSTDGGRDFACAQGQHCCQPSTGTSTCAADCSGAPDGGTDWQCDEATDCPGSQVCCAITSGTGQDQGCSFVFLHLFKGTVCAATCAVGQIQVCEQASGECTTGTCTPTRAKGSDFGTCD